VDSPGETKGDSPHLFHGGTTARLEDLAKRYRLRDEARGALERMLALVATDETAPTTVRRPEEAVDVHVADSLSGLEAAPVREARRIADLGAGAGFPGLVLAAALPHTQISLVESVGKKCAFMERAIEAAALPNARVICARAEEVRDEHDVVTARALAPLAVLAEYAAPLLRLGGSLVAWKGARDAAEEDAARRAAAELGLEQAVVLPVRPWEGVEQRHLYLYSKVTETPPRFPRRPGMARKRPLGAST
jgi:16S rRNA (guanine527-N7)-methyltransferase